jgi:hypothetical protein
LAVELPELPGAESARRLLSIESLNLWKFVEWNFMLRKVFCGLSLSLRIRRELLKLDCS